ncbi:site-specific integrase [Caenispirillum bisanense]|uniref:site-specific integrase n=1 Tax=Caenispirillum bisanense TaxID=414052 RepID=UPI0031E1D5BE
MTYLARKPSGRYHLRVRVPRDLVPVIGRQEIRRSLGTSERQTASILAGAESARLRLIMGEMRLAIDQNDELALRALKAEVMAYEVLIETYKNEKAMGERLKAANARLKAVSHNVSEFCGRYAEAREIRDSLQEVVKSLAAVVQPRTPADPLAGLHPDARQPLDALLPAFLADVPQPPKRLAEYETELARWRRANGDKAVAEITRQDVIQYHDLLLSEVKPRKGATVASWVTQNKALSCIRMVLGWATDTDRRRGELPTVRVSPKGVTKAERERVKRRSWREEELRAIFAAPLYTGCRSKSRYSEPGDEVMFLDGRYWLPLVALMTGARLGELTQLRLSDVVETRGVVYLNVTTEASAEDDADDQAKTAKTENAVRMLPVHPELGRLGIADYIHARRKADPTGLLFEPRDYGKFFNDHNRFFARVGVKSDVTSFHSFRHTHKDMLRALRDSDLRDRLMGHAPRSVGEGYGSPLTEAEVADFFKLVRPPIDLGHLYPGRGR